jgi:Cys-tRNA(Pro) deacylase
LPRHPTTPATVFLDDAKAEYTEHSYNYRKSGAVLGAELMGVDAHAVIKTLVMEDEDRNPFIVLMHGEKEVSLKDLARELGVKNVSTCSVRDAQRYTGYMVGGISPFGTRRELPVYMERSILDLPYMYINGGRRGFILGMKPSTLSMLLDPKIIEAAR